MSRTVCIIEGCHRTTARVFDEWICAVHWQRLTRVERRVWYRIKRTAKRFGWEAVLDRDERVWSALKRRATA